MTSFPKSLTALTALAALASAFLAAGCAQNAALEIAIELPAGPADGSRVFVLVQPRKAADNPFEDEWRGDDLAAVELLEGESFVDNISVMSTDDTTDLNLKVRFCASPNCTAIEDDTAPELWYALQHPFYIGERTSWGVEIFEIPLARDTEPDVVEKCQIKGCVDGPLSSYCRMDERHLCE